MKRPIDATTLRAEFTGNFNDGYYTVAEIKAIIDTAPTLDEAINVPGKWISVKDRLPEKSGTYLCYQPKAADICALNAVRWSTQRGWMGKEVGSRIEGIEYWMPLPEPPEVSKDVF